jgi:hypothetical protein
MTTGCTCQTPCCPGVTYRPGHRCARCRIDATPSALKRAVMEEVGGSMRSRACGGPVSDGGRDGTAMAQRVLRQAVTGSGGLSGVRR